MTSDGFTAQGPPIPELQAPSYRFSDAKGIGLEPGVCRRDPSDIIKVGETYYVWYSKVCEGPNILYPSGYWATVWYATSNDGHHWMERGETVGKGGAGAWDEHGVFTPSILEAKGMYYVLYTAVPAPFENQGDDVTPTAIGMAVSQSPDGPWEKLGVNPILETSSNPEDFDSMRVDDACMLVRHGKYWLYYKGRQRHRTPAETRMGVAIADQPQGPYVKHAGNPLISSGHEVLVWPHREGVAALVSPTGPEGRTIQYAPDGVHFQIVGRYEGHIGAPGAYRPDAFTDEEFGRGFAWGLAQIGGQHPHLVRFDIDLNL